MQCIPAVWLCQSSRFDFLSMQPDYLAKVTTFSCSRQHQFFADCASGYCRKSFVYKCFCKIRGSATSSAEHAIGFLFASKETLVGAILKDLQCEKRCSNRNGLTLVEVLVVLLTLLALAAFFLPAMRSARGPARRAQCLNNQRNLALAVLNFASSNRARLPAQAYCPGRNAANGTGWETYEGRSWVVELIPHLDHNDLYDRWDFDEP